VIDPRSRDVPPRLHSGLADLARSIPSLRSQIAAAG
jgi:hypothetical protein